MQTDNDLQNLPGTFEIKEFRNLRIEQNNGNSVIITDDEACVVYKICIYPTHPNRNGEDLAKKIESDYIAKIYDLINTIMTITRTKQVVHIKILAMERLYRIINADNFYTHFKGKYIDCSKYSDEKLFYYEIFKPVVQRILQHL
ncbi:hypothetical protein COBT_002332, partial [Conglomerata obtusa]